MSDILNWIKENPFLTWCIVSAGASLIYRKLDQNSRAHAVFSSLASVGIDIPKFLEKLPQVMTGKKSAE